MTKQGQKIGEDKYSEKWSLDGETYVLVPKWVIKQVWNEAIKECEGCVPETKQKHDDLVNPKLLEDADHDDWRWDLVDISATHAEAFNSCREQTLQAIRSKLRV